MSTNKRNLPSSPSQGETTTGDPHSNKKPRRSSRIQSKTEPSVDMRESTPPTPIIDNLKTPRQETFSTRTETEGTTSRLPSSAPSSPQQTFEATQLATQVASQFVQPPSDSTDVWGYLLPLDMDKSYGLGDVLTLRKRSSCNDGEASDSAKRGRGRTGGSACGDGKGGKGAPSGYLIGRHVECDLRLSQPTVSNRHCVIFREISGKTTKAIIEDLSSNGTWIGGSMVGRNNRRELRNGDEIKLVDGVRFMFRYPQQTTTGSFSDYFEIPANGTLGSGHFATVFVAIEKSTGQKYAVKVFKKRRKDDGRGQMGLQQEIAVLMSVHHPNVLCLKETFDEEEGIYLILELASEGELFNLIIEKGKLSEEETRKVYIQLLNGLKYLHERNIVHRDIKPENILLTDKNLTCKLADFGLAKIIGEDSFTTSLCGTPSYVAPEILMPSRNRKYTKAVDIWSLGVVLYICLCGFPPFSDELAPPNLRDQIKEGRFDYPSPYWDSIGDAALDLIDRMLTIDPDERITVEEALEHPWVTNTAFDPGMSTDSDASLAGHMQGLAMRRTKLERERTLIADMVKDSAVAESSKPRPEPLNGTKPAVREVAGERDAFVNLGKDGAAEPLFAEQELGADGEEMNGKNMI
ncbi:hypothetical protein H072_10052 [Dactylellina haptotyla CBS 200.50]|uniref:Pkinase-domain-containing protein n=1 Tax=Dactylellina haptotyla (strain CBS 200.50) TaxID=1284197 RepID=S8A0C4_DACHA|nr:hypothetical protein H072_10052 [Dactylellina haptotyla CBS 200.50]